MEGEIKFFRKRFIGGFNRQDVIEYVAGLSMERDEYIAAKERAERYAQMLSEEIVALKHELKEAIRVASEYKTNVLDSAITILAELESNYRDVRAEIEVTSADICAELDVARNAVTAVPTTFRHAGEQFSKLWAVLDTEKNVIEDMMLGVDDDKVEDDESKGITDTGDDPLE